MKAMLLAAGLGTRLRPITNTLPKPLVPVCNRPLIEWAVDALVDAGVHDIVVNLHHLPEAITNLLAKRTDAHFEFSHEPKILGTGGGVRNVRNLLENEDEFFLVNGDTIQFPPFAALRDARRDAIAALVLRHAPANDNFTPVYLANGRVTGFGSGTGEPLMFSGAHLISSRIFQYLNEKTFRIIATYESLLGEITGVVDDGLWFDIGTPQRYREASRALLDAIVRGELATPRDSHIEGDSLVHDSADIRGVIAHSVIGAHTTVRGDVRDSSVWDDCTIDGTVERCIVSHGVMIRSAVTDDVIVQ
ncbi:MAG TPA: sugar phosphate nucleotidyltransferase [Thermoanaerobaculia bacterium]|nr:sugar phosphate nucleotidyltransferase [Thermoanaerobaculia bacterium]